MSLFSCKTDSPNLLRGNLMPSIATIIYTWHLYRSKCLSALTAKHEQWVTLIIITTWLEAYKVKTKSGTCPSIVIVYWSTYFLQQFKYLQFWSHRAYWAKNQLPKLMFASRTELWSVAAHFGSVHVRFTVHSRGSDQIKSRSPSSRLG